jgi:(p)ppGpp synthase/HD superfamily hydrolase
LIAALAFGVPARTILVMPTIEDAIALAVEAHRGQRDKSGEPYILHVLRVMLRLDTEAERIVAVLHDVVEDTGRTPDDLRGLGYPEEVVTAVACVTKREGEFEIQIVVAPERLLFVRLKQAPRDGCLLKEVAHLLLETHLRPACVQVALARTSSQQHVVEVLK